MSPGRQTNYPIATMEVFDIFAAAKAKAAVKRAEITGAELAEAMESDPANPKYAKAIERAIAWKQVDFSGDDFGSDDFGEIGMDLRQD